MLIPVKIKIKKLFEKLDLDNNLYEKLQISKIKIKIKTSKDNLVDIKGFVKKQNKKILKLETKNGTIFKCAENHILIDENNKQVFAKNAKNIQTKNGIDCIISKSLYSIDDVYDISIPSPHIYQTPNGIIHHNTTILGDLLHDLSGKGLSVACATYTGKASHVLRTKIPDFTQNVVSTIHGLIYRPLIDEETGELIGFVKQDTIDYDLIIVDECSMIDQNIFNDLISYNVPVIFIGDSAQLPPVSNQRFDIFKHTLYELKEIHRQAENSPIIKLSMLVRNGEYIKAGIYGKGCAKIDWEDDKAKKALYEHDPSKNDIVLCGINKTRVILNNMIREKMNFVREEPEIGEKLVCLANNHSLGIMNGQLGYVEEVKLFEDFAYKMKMDFGSFSTSHMVFSKGFNKVKQEEFFEVVKNVAVQAQLTKENFDKLDLFDYGNALSVHKSQGSSWERVILINERTYYQSDEDYAKWLYTGITRAEEKLLIIDNF